MDGSDPVGGQWNYDSENRQPPKSDLEIPKPFKRYQVGSVWRNEKPGPGRYREFLQFDADFVGTKSLQADAELCVLISEILENC